MSSLLDSYEEDYQGSIRLLTDNMGAIKDSILKQNVHENDPTVIYSPPPSTGPNSRSYQLREVQQILAHVKDLITSMNYEVNDVKDPHQRAAIKSSIANYQKNIVALEGEALGLRQACAAAERKDLLWFDGYNTNAGLRNEVESEAKIQRLMSLQTTEALQSGTSTLLRAEAYLEQGKASGRMSLNTLKAQTEQIGFVGNIATNVDAELFASRQIINRMQSVAFRRKLFLSAIIVIMIFFIILFLIYH